MFDYRTSEMDLTTYSKNITDFITGSYITSALRLGMDLGLFDELKKRDESVTSQQLADACNLKERYVREWLGCMVSTRIVSLDDSDKYYIPQSLKPGLSSLGFTFFVPTMAAFTDKVKNCFKKDGPEGYAYQDMPPGIVEANEEQAQDPDNTVKELLKPVSTTKPLESLTTILDLGCGGGCATRALRRRLPTAVIYSVDYSKDALITAEATAKAEGLKDLNFVQEDITSLPAAWTRKFDWVIMLDVLHDLPDPVNAMKEVRRVLKDDGVASIVDPDIHSNHRDNIGDVNYAGVGYAISSMVCLPCSLSTDGAAGNGMGWGTENKEAFLTSSGWRVEDKRNIESPFALNFTCVKA